ncbi:OmpL47-type beta-barrel domain-containing protein [Paenibacillus nanensis]|uniref:OmpL47-type beta-barrel domain-containing protein n=1 Tax=Paenibacillus nanensis TaxID=393251 RepID=UPI001F0C86EC|nr:hypothetical protein [Paenibacillus nanensis]
MFLALLVLLQAVLPLSRVSADTNGSILPPSNLAVQMITADDVKLTWSAVFGATGYNVYEIADGSLNLVGTATTTSYTFSNMIEGSYRYVVSTLSPDGESGPGAPVSFTVTYPEMEAPATLTHTIANGNDVVLSWAASANAEIYNVYQIGEDGQGTLVKSTSSRTYTITNAPEGVYTYAVTASHSLYGVSPLSATLQVTVTKPTMTAPANLAFTITNLTDVTLSWTSVPYSTNYRVYQIVDGQKVLKSTVAATSVKYVNLPAGDYTYQVFSYSDRFGESAEGSEVSLTVGSVTMAPPAELTYKIQNGNDIVLTWTASSNADSYKIYQIIDGVPVLKSTVKTTTVTYSNMPSGDYQYEVHSNSSRYGESETGTPIRFNLTVPTMQPPANIIQKLTSPTSFSLSWDSADYATSYKVYQVVDGKKVLKSTVTGLTVAYSNMAPGEYSYIVHAYSSRFGESAEGAEITFTVEGVVLDAPTNLTYTLTNFNDITLKWTGAANATGYKVYQIVDGQKVLKGTVSGLTVTYTNVPEGSYEYEVHSTSALLGESPEGAAISLTVVYPTILPPANLTYKVQNGNDVVLSWQQAANANSYKVYELVDGQEVLKSTVTALAATLSNVSEGEHTYVVRTVSSRFGQSIDGTQVELTMVFPVMAAPGNITQSIANGNDLTLRWGSAPYANSYKVYQIVDGQKELKTTVTGTNATFAKLPAGDYTFVIHSYSNRYGESREGGQIDVTIEHQEMAPPANLKQTVLNGNDIKLQWDAATYATSYNVYQIVNDQKILKMSLSKTTYTFANMPEGDYTFVVHSVSTRFGESEQGSEVSFTLSFPIMEAPGDISKSIVNGNDIKLQWVASTYATSYNIYQIVDGQKVLKRSQTGTTFTFANMPEGEYTFVVHSVSSRFGESEQGSKLSFALIFPIMQAPSNLTSSIANGNDIVLKWNAAAYSTAYTVYQIVDGEKVLKATVKSNSATLTNMPEGPYLFEVHSYSDRFGESPEGTQKSLTLTWPILQAPKLTATVVNANDITFTWPSAAWVSEYRLYEVNGETRTLVYKGTALKAQVYNLTEDTHRYVLTVYNTRFGESAPSEAVEKTIVYPVMQAPEASLVLLDKTTARISWDFVIYANGYNVYELVDGEPVLLIKNLNNLSYKISDLSYKNHYYYVTSYSNSFGESEPSAIVEAKLIVDTEAPKTVATAPEGWTNQNAEITLKATDNETGVANTFYSLDGGSFVAGTALTVSEAGVHTLTFYSVDNVGNKEQEQTIEIKIDKTSPVTSASAPVDWSKDDVVVTFAGADERSGVAKTYYAVNGGAYTEGTAAAVTSEGVNQVRFYSVDQAGNKEQEQTIEVKIDKTAPVTSAAAPAGWSKDNISVTFEATDAQSGVAKTYYAVNDEAFKEGGTVSVTSEGVNQVRFYSVDLAGNKEQEQTIKVKIDKTAPTISFNPEHEYAMGSSLILNYNAVDELSGITEQSATIAGPNDAAAVPAAKGSTFTFKNPGVYTITIRATNGAGLTTVLEKQVTVYLAANIEVTPAIIKGNKGEFTVRVTLPAGFNTQGFDLLSVTLNGVKALSSNNGYFNQAKNGQFKFERSDFAWSGSEAVLQFRGYVNGILVVGQTKVKVQK